MSETLYVYHFDSTLFEGHVVAANMKDAVAFFRKTTLPIQEQFFPDVEDDAKVRRIGSLGNFEDTSPRGATDEEIQKVTMA